MTAHRCCVHSPCLVHIDDCIDHAVAMLTATVYRDYDTVRQLADELTDDTAPGVVGALLGYACAALTMLAHETDSPLDERVQQLGLAHATQRLRGCASRTPWTP